MLIDLIKLHCLVNAQAGNWSAVAETLNAQTVEVRNPKSWTMADLIGLVQPEGAALVGGTIKAAGAGNPIFDGAWIALNVTGLQLHTDERQQMIDGLALAGNWPDQLRDTVKAAGLTYTSLAGDTVTAEQCQAAWAADQVLIAKQSLTVAFHAYLNAIGTSEQANRKADLLTALEVG